MTHRKLCKKLFLKVTQKKKFSAAVYLFRKNRTHNDNINYKKNKNDWTLNQNAGSKKHIAETCRQKMVTASNAWRMDI
jgi:hypothetical protein